MFQSLVISILISISPQQAIVDTGGGGGGDGLPGLSQICTITSSGNTLCILRWAP
jgi:hypothetical protein